MGFKADDAVPALEWDFRPFVDAHGVSPEPSNKAIYQFNQQFRSTVDAVLRVKKALIQQEIKKLEGRPPEELEAELAKWAKLEWQEATDLMLTEISSVMPSEEVLAIADRQCELVAELLQNCPTKEQISGLPGRIKAAYLGWIVGQVMSPELAAVDTNS